MKKLIVLLLVCLLPLSALAEMDADGNVSVTLPGVEIFFTPIEGHCLTRESSASVFNRLGLSQRDVVPWMEAYDVYALLFDQTGELEIQVMAYPTTDMDFDDQTTSGLERMREACEKFYISQGYDVESAETYYTQDGHSYVRIAAAYTYEDGFVEHMAEYFTCQSGYAVYVTAFPYEGPLTEMQIFLCESVVGSLWVSEDASTGEDE